MVKIFDNIINDFEQDILRNYLLNELQWSFIEDVSLEDNLHQKRPGFKIIFKEKNPINVYIQNILTNTANKIKLKEPKLLEARSFLQLPLNKEFLGEGVDTPHLDRTEPHLVFLYYVTDSDGDTIIYNYRSKDENDIPYFEDVKELKRVTPKQGRVVVFNGLNWHTAEQPTKDVRCIINLNINGKNIDKFNKL